MRTIVCLFMLMVANVSFAQEKPKTPPRRVPADVARQIKDKTPQQIVDMLTELNEKEIPVGTLDDVADFKRKKGNALIGMADALLNLEPDDIQAEKAYQMKINGLGLLMQLKPDDTKKISVLKKELEELKKYPDVVVHCDAYLYIQKIRKTFMSKRVSEKDYYQVANELKPLVQKHPDSPYVAAAGLVLSGAAAFEGTRNLDGFADKFRDEFIKTFRDSGNEKLIEIAKKIEIDAQQAVVPGKRLAIAGMTVGGQPFDLKMLRGKIVLIDFWATWCGPCKGEVPGMKEAYAKYKARGFEIVGISIDKQIPALQSYLTTEQIPWITVSDTMTTAAGMPSLADRYGIRGIPTMYLVDREGRIISTQARGDALKRLLEKEFR